MCILVALVVLQVATAVPVYDDYSEAEKGVAEQPNLYDMLIQRELLMNKINEMVGRHSVVRKSERYPTMRLRFGKRSDQSMLARLAANPDVTKQQPN